MNEKRIERMLRELHTYPMMPVWTAPKLTCTKPQLAGWAGTTLLAALLLASPSPQAGEREALTITSVRPETEPSVLVIEGRNLSNAVSPTLVHLHGVATPLSVIKASDRAVVARMPADIPWANYLLRVSRGSQPGEFHQVPVDIGIVGPAVQEN